jgi:hypothetical protein
MSHDKEIISREFECVEYNDEKEIYNCTLMNGVGVEVVLTLGNITRVTVTDDKNNGFELGEISAYTVLNMVKFFEELEISKGVE